MTSNAFASALKSVAPKSVPAVAVPSSPGSSRGRVNRKHVGGYFDPAVAKQLRLLASEEETTVQELLTEALRLLFAQRGITLP